jgi:hypothetical protein
MQVRSVRHRHRITTLMIGGKIAHHQKHIVERQDTGGIGCNTSLLGCAIARTLLLSAGFATACHSI